MAEKQPKIKKLDKSKSSDKLASKSSPMLTLKNAFSSSSSLPNRNDSKPNSPTSSQPSSPPHSARDSLQKSKSHKGFRDGKPNKMSKTRSNGYLNERGAPRRPANAAPEKVNDVIKNLTIKVKEESPSSPRPSVDQIFGHTTQQDPIETNEEKIYHTMSEKIYNTLFVKEIEQFKENPDSYSTVVFKGKPENESDDQDNDQDNENQYSTVVLKGADGSEDEGQYGTVVMKGARDQDEGGPQYGTTLLKSRAPKTLKFLDPAYAKTTVDLAEEKEQANEKVDEKNAELLAEAHTTILGLIEENQLKLQDLLEKVCMVTNLDILFVLTNSLKSIRADIMKMKRHVPICNYSINFTAQRDEDRLQQAIGALFMIETFVAVRAQMDPLENLQVDC